MTKLNWEYCPSGDYEAEYKGLTLIAELDSCPENPFYQWDGHWPMTAYYARRTTHYDKTIPGVHINDPLSRFTDHTVILMQKHIANALGTSIREITADFAEEPTDWCTDSDALHEAFYAELGSVPDSHRLGVQAALYDALGIPNVLLTTRGYCQGDEAEVLVVATPEAQKELRSQPEGVSDEEWRAMLDADMTAQVALYGTWAWGDVYGYIIEDKHGNELDSCWGYYGSEFDESGLEGAAMESADHIAKVAHETRLTTLRDLVRNRVPLEHRQPLLEQAGEPQHV